MSLPYRSTLRTISRKRLLRINAQESRTGDARFRAVPETLAAIRSACEPREAMLGAWAAHPDERVPIALLQWWNRILGNNVSDYLNAVIWETLATRALRDADDEGALWTPLLDAIGMAKDASPRTTGFCEYWQGLQRLQSWIAAECDPERLSALLHFNYYRVREPALLRLALLEPSRIAQLWRMHASLAFEALEHRDCSEFHVEEFVRLAIEDIRNEQRFYPVSLPPYHRPDYSREAACRAVMLLRKLGARGHKIQQHHVIELELMAMSGSVTVSGHGVSMAARYWSVEALLHLGISVPGAILDQLYEVKVRQSDPSREMLTRFALHPNATHWILNDLANRADDDDTRPWDDLAEAELVQNDSGLRRRVAMRASFAGLRTLAKYCDEGDWGAIFRRYTSTRKGDELLRVLETVSGMARRDQLGLITYADWRRFLRVSRRDTAAATRILTRLPSACRHKLGQQHISAFGNSIDWMMILPEMSGKAARKLFQKLAAQRPAHAAEALQESPQLLNSLKAIDLLPLLECEDEQWVREVAMNALAVVRVA